MWTKEVVLISIVTKEHLYIAQLYHSYREVIGRTDLIMSKMSEPVKLSKGGMRRKSASSQNSCKEGRSDVISEKYIKTKPTWSENSWVLVLLSLLTDLILVGSKLLIQYAYCLIYS